MEETSAIAEVGIATNSLKDKSTDSTEVEENTSRGSERNLHFKEKGFYKLSIDVQVPSSIVSQISFTYL